MKLGVIVNQYAGAVARYCLLHRSAEDSDIQRPLSGKVKRSYETKRMFKSLMKYVCDSLPAVSYLLLYTRNAWQAVCSTDTPKATLWSVKVRRCAALPSRHNGTSRYSDVRYDPIIPTRDIWLDKKFLTRSTVHRCVASSYRLVLALRPKYATLAAMCVKLRDAFRRRYFATQGSCICS
jgi:hypothetical protein